MGKTIGYAKMGRSMTLNGLDDCGTLGGDVEMIPPLKALAERHPDDTFVVIGRNTVDTTKIPGMPDNVVNLWTAEVKADLRKHLRAAGLGKANLSVEEHQICNKIYDEITGDWFTNLDDIIIWSGQHGTTNTPIPKIGNHEVLTKPYDWCAYYVSYLLRGINKWRTEDPWEREEVWLNADPRNYLKCRDMKWPLHHPVLAQFKGEHNMKHYRHGGGWAKSWNEYFNVHTSDKEHGVVESTVKTIYSRLEVNGLAAGTPFGNLINFNPSWADRDHFGLFINEARREVNPKLSRLTAMKEWVFPLRPAWVHGKWSAESQQALMDNHDISLPIHPAPWDRYFPLLNSVRCTFTTPSSGSGWATTKPWEAFAAGTVCFFHPEYDKQDNILRDMDDYAKHWLRVKTPEELRQRVEHLNTYAGRQDWEAIVRAQRKHYLDALTVPDYLHFIESRIWK